MQVRDERDVLETEYELPEGLLWNEYINHIEVSIEDLAELYKQYRRVLEKEGDTRKLQLEKVANLLNQCMLLHATILEDVVLIEKRLHEMSSHPNIYGFTAEEIVSRQETLDELKRKIEDALAEEDA